jgi:hypothetical protein
LVGILLAWEFVDSAVGRELKMKQMGAELEHELEEVRA